MNMAEHTPTPWFKDIRCRIGPRFETDDQSDGMLDDLLEVYGENRDANAAFIVKACNSHDALVNVLTDARNAIASLPMEALGYASDPMGQQIHWPIRDELLHRIDEALRATTTAPTPLKGSTEPGER